MFVVVGVTGGIAAYKTVQLVRTLVTNGHDVHVVPTDDALRFVGTATWEAVSRNPVTTSVHTDVAEVRHVALGTSADLVVVAPATANTLAKMAAGIADNLLGVTLLATTAPVVVAPAMHTAMWEHAATQASIATLRERGVHVVGPADGPLTGGDSGPGRMVEPDEIAAAALAVAGARADLAGLRVAVSTGGTREPIDPVRYLGNRSSGRQGATLAVAAADRGALVTLVAAHTDDGVLDAATRHPHITLVRASTAADLEAAMTDAAARADIVAMVAAVADYRVAAVSTHKLRKEDGTPRLDLVENPDILAGLVAGRRAGQTIVGFAAETVADDAELLDRGRRKLARKGVDFLAVNRVDGGRGFEASDNRIVLLDAAGTVAADVAGSKRTVADAVWDAVGAAHAAGSRRDERNANWERRYAEPGRVWSGRVNVTLAAIAATLTPGSALEVGCGEGADAIWLAEHGWRVTALDVSASAVATARDAAAERGLDDDRVRFVAGDAALALSATGSVGAAGRFDLVVSSFLHSWEEDFPRIAILRAASALVAPGGRMLTISHAAPPPWAHDHHSPVMRTPAEELALLDLDPGEWTAERVEVVTREARDPDGNPATLDDGILLLRRD